MPLPMKNILEGESPANYRMPPLKQIALNYCSEALEAIATAVAVFHFPVCQQYSAKLRKILRGTRLQVIENMAPQVGLEPTTLRLTAGLLVFRL